MKKIIFFIGFWILATGAFGQPGQFNKYNQRVHFISVMTDSFQGLPLDTFAVASIYRSYPWLAYKANHVYVWSITELKYNRVDSGGAGGGGGNRPVFSGYGLIQVNDSTLKWDSATAANYFVRKKDSLTGTNPLGYVTKNILADTALAIRAAFVTPTLQTVTNIGKTTTNDLTLYAPDPSINSKSNSPPFLFQGKGNNSGVITKGEWRFLDSILNNSGTSTFFIQQRIYSASPGAYVNILGITSDNSFYTHGSLVTGVGSYGFSHNANISGSNSFQGGGQNTIIEASGVFSGGTDGHIYNAANYASNLGDANENWGEASLAANFGNDVYDQNGVALGNDNIVGALSAGTGASNQYQGGISMGTQNRSTGNFVKMIGRAIQNEGAETITIGSGIANTNTRLRNREVRAIYLGQGSDTATVMIHPATGAGTFAMTTINGALQLGNIPYTNADSMDILSYDTLSHKVYRKRITGVGGGGSQTLQQTFNQEIGGSLLTKNDTILLGGNSLRINGASSNYVRFNSTSTQLHVSDATWETFLNFNTTNGNISATRTPQVSGISGMLMISDSIYLISENTSGPESWIKVKPDSIVIKPNGGNLKITTLNAGVGTVAIRYNPLTHNVTYTDTTAGGGSTSAVNYIGTMQILGSGAGGGYIGITSGVGDNGTSQGGTNTANIVFGDRAGSNLTTGQYNTLLGLHAGHSITGGNDNFFAGWDAGFNTQGGSGNIGFPQDALYSNTGGSDNIGLGRGALYSNTASSNIAFGYSSGYDHVSNGDNIFGGLYSGEHNTNGSNNVFWGSYSGNNANEGIATSNSVLIGYSAGFNAEGINLVGLGTNVLYNATGLGNIAMGYHAADNITTAQKNIVIGYDIDAPSATTGNQLNIGNVLFGAGFNTTTGTTISSTGKLGILNNAPDSTLTLSGSLNVTTHARIQQMDSTSSARNIVYQDADGTLRKAAVPTGGGGVSDGDKGDITISISGTTYIVDQDITKSWTGVHTFGGGFAITSYQNITSGSSSTINNPTTTVRFDPASDLGAYTLTMPASPVDGQWIYISFGGTITAGNAVVSTFTLSPNSGQSIYSAITLNTGYGGDEAIFQYKSSNTTWYRKK